VGTKQETGNPIADGSWAVNYYLPIVLPAVTGDR